MDADLRWNIPRRTDFPCTITSVLLLKIATANFCSLSQLFYSDLENRVAVGYILRFRTQFCVLRGLGQSLNKHETVSFRESGNWQFSQSGYRFALLAAFFAAFFVLSYPPVLPKNIFQKLSKILRPTPIKSYL